jgi:hypothetical protein
MTYQAQERRGLAMLLDSGGHSAIIEVKAFAGHDLFAHGIRESANVFDAFWAVRS